MLWIFRVISERLKAMFVADVALGLESEFLSRQADRKVELLNRADQFEEQGRASVAAELRAQAEAISLTSPLATIVPVMERLQFDHTEPAATAANLEHVPSPTSSHGGAKRRATKTPATKKRATKKVAKKRARSR